jgi:hypothetical protein
VCGGNGFCPDVQTVTHLDRVTNNPVKYHNPYLRTRFSETGGIICSKPRERDQSRLSLVHPLFNPPRLPDTVFANESGISRRTDDVARFAGGSIRRLVVGGKESGLDRLQRAGKRFGCEAGCLLRDILGNVRITST